MITNNHVAAFFLAAKECGFTDEEIRREIPFLLLPDAIRMYTQFRPISHFERTSNDSSVSWICFPSEEELKSGATTFNYFYATGYRPAVIGESTDITVFDQLNASHKHFIALRCHFVQDIFYDTAVREEWLDTSGKYDDHYIVRHSGIAIDGATLRRALQQISYLQFVQFAKLAYEQYGIVLNNEWLRENVYKALCAVYPMEMAENTFKFINLPEEIEHEITSLSFNINNLGRNFNLSYYLDDTSFVTDVINETLSNI